MFRQWLNRNRTRRRGIRRRSTPGRLNGVEKGLSIEPLEQRQMLAVLFAESFDGATLNPAFWETPALAGQGVISITATQSVDVGGQSLVFASSGFPNTIKDLNEAILTVDLAGATSAILTFQQLEGSLGTAFDDETDLLADTYTVGPGSFRPSGALGDGLSISADGITWYKMLDVRGFGINRTGDGLWELNEYDLVDNVNRINSGFGASLTLAGPIKIKWSQYDDRFFPSDGWAIDEVKIVDAEETFSASLPQDVFQRLGLASDPEVLYRVALLGNVDANTPIVVSMHGAGREIIPHTRVWQRFAADATNNVTDLIVIAPFFASGTKYDDYGELAWNTLNNAQADQVLIDIVAEVTSAGFGDGSQLYLSGFSRGSHFVENFTWAHPDLVAAAVISSSDKHTFPDPTEFYPFGIADNFLRPRPSGVTFDPATFLPNRLMFWIGDEDFTPTNNTSPALAQGQFRTHRMVNMFEEVHTAAAGLGLSTANYEYELFIQEGKGHFTEESDVATFYEFLFRDFNPIESPILVHPVLVTTQTALERQSTLPIGTIQVQENTDFFLEIWVEAPGATGVVRGSVDIVYDTTILDATLVDHGSLFNTTTTGTLDDVEGWVRNFSGETAAPGVGVGEFALLGRVQFHTATGVNPSQVLLALQRGSVPFGLEGNITQRTDLQPLSATFLVNELNAGPQLVAIGNQQAGEGTLVTFDVDATDPNIGDQLTFTLDPGAPSGATIDPNSGIFQWTPTEADGPGTFPVTVRVSDNGVPLLSDFESITITIDEINQAPVLALIGNQVINENDTLMFTAAATDVDQPANTLLFSLGSGAPAGASIDPQSGDFSWNPTDNFASPVSIQIIVSDDGSPVMQDSETIQVTVNNVAPTLFVSAPTSGVRGQPLSFALTATDVSPVDQADVFTYEFDWNGDFVVDETILGSGSFVVEHAFPSTGSKVVLVTATDKDGGKSSSVILSVNITKTALQPDAGNPSLTNLVIGGTGGADEWFLTAGGGNVSFMVLEENGVPMQQLQSFAGVTGEILVYAQGGADRFNAIMNVDTPIFFDGGAGDDEFIGGRADDTVDGGAGNDILIGFIGDDQIAGGAGDDVLVGFKGNDVLTGGTGRDILFGGLGADSLDGGADDDLLAAGPTRYTVDLPSLSLLRDEWVSANSFTDRVLHLQGTPGGVNGSAAVIVKATVFNDLEVDTLVGGLGLDWFLHDFFADLLSGGVDPGEEETNLDP